MDMLRKFLPQTFNDLLCVLVMGGIGLLWSLDGFGWKGFELNTEVMTASIVFFTLIGQYYFRKKQGENH